MKRSIACLTLVVAIGACADQTESMTARKAKSATHDDGDAAPDDAALAPDIVRKTDYGEALRSASLKLVGELPTLAEIKNVDAASDKKAAFEASVDAWLADPRFEATQVEWWKNTFKTETDAASFAAQVVVHDRPYTDILPVALSDKQLMAQYWSNMAFRRVRFVQETFDCTHFPAEVRAGTPMGNGIYTSPWDFDSIAGGAGSKIDFHDTSSVICANCHTTMNHLAPLFANFDDKGVLQSGVQVQTPVTPPVKTVLADWLPAGQTFAWRSGQPVSDLGSLAATMAKDPDVLACAVVRVWNWALSRGDVVNDGAKVPPEVIAEQTAAFTRSGLKMKSLIRNVFTSEDFVQF